MSDPTSPHYDPTGNAMTPAEQSAPRGPVTSLEPDPEPTTEELIEVLREAMQHAWDDFVGDTGCYPDDFTIVGDELHAEFGRSNFVRFIVNWLESDAETTSDPIERGDR